MITMGSIQSGDAQVLTFTGPALAFTYTNAQVLILSTQTHDTYVSYSEGGLQQDSTRFKIQKESQEQIIPLPLRASGFLYFASANVAATALVTMWQI